MSKVYVYVGSDIFNYPDEVKLAISKMEVFSSKEKAYGRLLEDITDFINGWEDEEFKKVLKSDKKFKKAYELALKLIESDKSNFEVYNLIKPSIDDLGGGSLSARVYEKNVK